ncbi:hypothetical protein [Alteromonas sp. RKMC-009]|uniref:hypothetical protein n=1 Tax=Alteromonas sp. RKMC-009 TaxID=2267264 RepID=UPI000E6903A0|nr:hypothetical protein [Alteromonas sp. RKMC-009]AYA64280.1 hypothetical protein DS731_09895 [Alteromonas sp. RKMC-009]
MSTPNRPDYNRDFKVGLLQLLRNHLTETFYKSRQNTINRIAVRHNELTQTKPGFRHNKTPYFHESLTALPFQLKRLHESLRDEFDMHLEDWTRLWSYVGEAEVALIQVLSFMGNINDLYELLPHSLHSQLPGKDGTSPFRNKEELEDFKNTHAQQLKSIRLVLAMKTMRV